MATLLMAAMWGGNASYAASAAGVFAASNMFLGSNLTHGLRQNQGSCANL